MSDSREDMREDRDKNRSDNCECDDESPKADNTCQIKISTLEDLKQYD